MVKKSLESKRVKKKKVWVEKKKDNEECESWKGSLSDQESTGLEKDCENFEKKIVKTQVLKEWFEESEEKTITPFAIVGKRNEVGCYEVPVFSDGMYFPVYEGHQNEYGVSFEEVCEGKDQLAIPFDSFGRACYACTDSQWTPTHFENKCVKPVPNMTLETFHQFFLHSKKDEFLGVFDESGRFLGQDPVAHMVEHVKVYFYDDNNEDNEEKKNEKVVSFLVPDTLENVLDKDERKKGWSDCECLGYTLWALVPGKHPQAVWDSSGLWPLFSEISGIEKISGGIENISGGIENISGIIENENGKGVNFYGNVRNLVQKNDPFQKYAAFSSKSRYNWTHESSKYKIINNKKIADTIINFAVAGAALALYVEKKCHFLEYK